MSNTSEISREEVVKLAKLAKLDLSQAEIETYQKDLSQIIDFVKQLQSLDLSQFEPTEQVTGLKNVTRPDESPASQLNADDLAALRPLDGQQLIVPRVKL